jgi:flagellar basal body-associated protein FliL
MVVSLEGIIIIIIIVILIYSHLLIIRWQYSGNARSQQEIKATYPNNLQIIIIIIIFCYDLYVGHLQLHA